MGLRGSYTGELWLEDCDVPASALLGQPGEGLRIVLEVLQLARTMIAAALVGLARAAFEAARAYSLERRQFGAPIREHQLVGETIARMRLEVDAARLLVLRAASELEVGRDASLSAAEAKLYASETAVKVTQAALQLHGGYGFTQELPLEMWVRDAMVGRIFFGTSEMQLLEIARSIDRD
jgi:alkylation response protein AidB-like acyl-CoA dehydrogenase